MPPAPTINRSTETASQIANDIINYLKLSKSTLAVAEAGTGGALMAALTSVEGCSSVFRGGIVTYATPLRRSLLDVERDLVADLGLFPNDHAAQMAEGVREATTPFEETGTSWGIGITEVAGPEQNGAEGVGKVHIGVAGPDGESRGFGPFDFPFRRERMREEVVLEAFSVLRDELRKARGERPPPYLR